MPQSKRNGKLNLPRAAPADYQRALLRVLKLETAPVRYGKSVAQIARALGRHVDTVERALRHLVSEGIVVKKRPAWYLRPDGKDSRTALYFFAVDGVSKMDGGALRTADKSEFNAPLEYDPQPDPDRRDPRGERKYSHAEVERLVERAAERAVEKYAARGGLSGQ